MADVETQKIIKEQFERLPKDVKDAVTSTRVREQIKAIGEKHQLHVDQIGALETETLFVMIGLEHPKEYIRNIAREVHLQSEQAQKIAVDINENVFRPVRESLKSIHEIADRNEEKTPHNQEEKKEEVATEPLLRLKKDFTPTVRPTISNSMIKTEETIKADDAVKTGEGAPERSFFKITPLRKSVDGETADIPRFAPQVESLSISKTFGSATSTQKTVPPPQNLPIENLLEKKAPVAIKDDNIADKLTKTFSIPRAETLHQEETKENLPRKESKYGSSDPYREPTG